MVFFMGTRISIVKLCHQCEQITSYLKVQSFAKIGFNRYETKRISGRIVTKMRLFY